MTDFENYTGLEAQLYDELWDDTEFDDESFYRWLLPEEGQAILDAGCGTGRLTVPLALDGYKISGLDYSREMLDICEKKAAEAGVEIPLYHQRMEDMRIDQKFHTILVPAFSFQLIPDRADARRAAKAILDHLEPGGQAVFATFVPWSELERPTEGLWRLRRAVERDEARGGGHLLSHEAVFLDRYEQLMTLWTRYEIYDAQRQLRQAEIQEGLIRWYLAHEFMSLLRDTGFTTINAYGDFLPEPAADGHTTVTYIGRTHS